MVASFVFATASVWACGDDDAASKPACTKDNPDTDIDESECAALATESAGETAVERRSCKTCHGDDMSGRTEPLTGKDEYTKTNFGETVKLYPPNLTSDEKTGLGSWDDDAIVYAIRYGLDKDAQFLCPQMQHYKTMSDFEAYSIVKYLRSIPSVSKKVPRSICPPTKNEGDK